MLTKFSVLLLLSNSSGDHFSVSVCMQPHMTGSWPMERDPWNFLVGVQRSLWLSLQPLFFFFLPRSMWRPHDDRVELQDWSFLDP